MWNVLCTLVCNYVPYKSTNYYLPAHGPLTRYVKLRSAHAPGMPGTFSLLPRVSDPDMHQGTCVTKQNGITIKDDRYLTNAMLLGNLRDIWNRFKNVFLLYSKESTAAKRTDCLLGVIDGSVSWHGNLMVDCNQEKLRNHLENKQCQQRPPAARGTGYRNV